MFYALSWLLVLALLATWSLAAWAVHGVAVWTVSSAGGLTGATSALGAITLPPGLAPWVPPELVQAMNQLVAGLGPWIDTLLQFAPTLAGGLTVAAWVIWALGGVLLLLLGAGLHLMIALWLRRDDGGRGPGTSTSYAAG